MKRKSIGMVILYILLIAAQVGMCTQADGFSELFTRSGLRALGVCVVVSIALYIMPLCLCLAKLAVLTQDSHKLFSRIDCTYNLASVFITVLTLVLFQLKTHDEIFGCQKTNVCNNLHDLVSMLLWLRSFPLLILGFTWLYMAMRHCLSGNVERVHTVRRDNVAIKEYLESRVRPFDQLNCDARATPCAICMCEFEQDASDDKIV